MYLEEYKNKLTNDYIVILKENGNKNELDNIDSYYRVNEEKTKGILTVYNISTDRVSDKSIYIKLKGKNKGRFYIKASAGWNKGNNTLWIDEFKIPQ